MPCIDCGWHICCPSVDPNSGLCCTKEVGHTGPHVACSTTQHRIATWGQKRGRRADKERGESEKKEIKEILDLGIIL